MNTDKKQKMIQAVRKSLEDKKAVRDFVLGKVNKNVLIERGIKFGRPI